MCRVVVDTKFVNFPLSMGFKGTSPSSPIFFLYVSMTDFIGHHTIRPSISQRHVTTDTMYIILVFPTFYLFTVALTSGSCLLRELNVTSVILDCLVFSFGIEFLILFFCVWNKTNIINCAFPSALLY